MIALLLALQASGPVPPEEAPKRFALPEGFRATLFAGEPDVVQPIAFTIDDRGRLWVVETRTYPGWLPAGAPGNDRILIFEDVDGDGRHDRRTVFADGLGNLTGIELGFGGVWLTQVPYLSFIPDRDGDDSPDGPPEVVLDGFDLNARHNVVNGLKWGPDGWLYGLNGILSNSKVGRPGTPDDRRIAFNCGVWRVHPETRAFEVVAWGTTNPWGLDWNESGELFITNCVIKHVFHVVPGGHYQRMYGEDPTPGLFGLMESPADHIHWGGGKWTESRGGQGAHDAPGGGHAHAGAMIYLGDAWPAEYRNSLFTSNIHGNRINRDRLERRAGGYVATHAPDFLRAGDPWFRALELRLAHDGHAYVTDWTDTGECHNYKEAHKGSGRIYKVTYGEAKPAAVDLRSKSDLDLVGLLAHPNDWFARHARRRLQERGLTAESRAALADLLRKCPLRAMWALHACGESLPPELFSHPDERVRAWAVRLDADDRASTSIGRLADMAANDPSALVRLHLASAAGRLPGARPMVEALAGREEDVDDRNLQLMVWYAARPLVLADPGAGKAILKAARLPLVREYVARALVTRMK